jgi:hypothetical protein
MNSNASNQEFTIWLEQYKQVKDDIRNYNSIHWQIASVLYILMGFFIGYGMPNVAEGGGEILVCISTVLIFILHITTFFYFRKLKDIKRDALSNIKEKITVIITGENENEKGKFYFLKTKPVKGLHPLFGFIIIFLSLALLAVALWQFPKNNQNFNQLQTISNLTKPSGNEPTNHIEMITSPSVNP